MMKLPVVETLQHKILRRVPARPEPLRFMPDPTTEVAVLEIENRVEYKVFGEFFFKQVAPVEALDGVRTNAVRELTRHIYGPVLQELYDVRQDMLEDGIDDTKAFKHVCQMIHELNGEPTY